ncbi:MAG TPA: hypothetical protein VGH19_08705 [Verrucomicrobiae bacterium]
MKSSDATQSVLQEQQALCKEILALTERENSALKQTENSSSFEVAQQRKQLLARLDAALQSLRATRQGMAPGQPLPPETAQMVRQLQDIIMRVLVLDRENEQALLRRGLVPARHVPPAARQKPHFVAELYRRQSV